MKKWKALPLCLAAVMSAGVCFAGCGEDGPNGGNNGGNNGEQQGTISGGSGTVNEALVKQLAAKISEHTSKGAEVAIDVSATMAGQSMEIDGITKNNFVTGDAEATIEMSQGTNKMYTYAFSRDDKAFQYMSNAKVEAWDANISLEYLDMSEGELPTDPADMLGDIVVFNAANYEILSLSSKTATVLEESTGYTVTVDLAQTARTLLGDITTVAGKIKSTSKINDILNDAVVSSYIESCFGLVKAKTVYVMINEVIGGAPTMYTEPGMDQMMQLVMQLWAAIPEPAENDGILDWLKKIADVDASALGGTGKLGDLTLASMGMPAEMDLGAMWAQVSASVQEKLDLVEKAEVVMTFDAEKNFVGQKVEFDVKNIPFGNNGGSGNMSSVSAREAAAQTISARGTLTFTYTATAPVLTDISACKVAVPTSFTFIESYTTARFHLDGQEENTYYNFALKIESENIILMGYTDSDDTVGTAVATVPNLEKFVFDQPFSVGNHSFQWAKHSEDTFVLYVYTDNAWGYWNSEDNMLDSIEMVFPTVGELLAD